MSEQILSGLNPHRVWKYFEDICHIPHGSGNTSNIANYLVDYAKKENLNYYRDDIGNVIIYAPPTPGYEDEPMMILQGHMDMVAVSDSSCPIDMMTDGLDLSFDDEFVFAKGTSLGGDDGIGIAYALAIMSDAAIEHPALEAVFTVDEEVGMDGAAFLDAAHINGNRMINIDNEEEGHILTGCAGGACAGIEMSLDMEKITKEDVLYSIHVKDGRGGHSGVEIDKGRANAIVILGRILNELIEKYSDSNISFVSINGGSADNAIPGECELILATDPECDICHITIDIVEQITSEYQNVEKKMKILTERVELSQKPKAKASRDSSKAVSKLLTLLPNGITAMSKDIPELVETSSNMGVIQTNDNKLILRCALRSSDDDAKERLMDTFSEIVHNLGAEIDFSGVYPGWKYRTDSPLRDKIVKIYNQMYDCPPIVEAIHAGLECGFMAEKIPKLDCVSIGPDILDIHTTSERMNISSVSRTFDLICRVLKEKENQ